MKRAVITGATGVIGSALVKNLISHGVEVLVLARKGSKRIGNIPVDPLISLKYCDLDGLSQLKNDTGKSYDVFYHLAWEGTTGAHRNDFFLQNKNVQYTLDAISAAAELGCKRFVGAGSQAEYGRAEGRLNGKTPTFPENGYGMAKLCAGLMGREFAKSKGIQFNWVRVLSIYGPDDGAGSMVMSAILKLRSGQVAQFTGGEQVWDYLYSGDAAEAFRLIAEKGVNGKTYVLGSGKGRHLYEYIADIAEILKAADKVALGALPYAENQVMYLVADVSELKNDTGWAPKTEFDEGIKATVESLKKN